MKWVNIPEFLNCFIKMAFYFFKKGVGQHHRNGGSTWLGDPHLNSLVNE
jgi:hypothetical protein